MHQQKVYKRAQELLRLMDDIPMARFTFGEALFLFRNCMWDRSAGGYNVIASFKEEDLLLLVKIAQRVTEDVETPPKKPS